ncbi:hypothetical protein IWX47DRAFT_877321 [Phyllosticta citricarpa]
MKFYIISLVLALFAVCALSVAPPQRSVLVSYSKDTPEKVLDEAKRAIIDAGGFITHEYSKLKDPPKHRTVARANTTTTLRADQGLRCQRADKDPREHPILGLRVQCTHRGGPANPRILRQAIGTCWNFEEHLNHAHSL